MKDIGPTLPRTVTIASDRLRAQVSTLGAELQRLTTADGRELQWNGDPAVWSGRAPILFPVIGQLQGGGYRLGDQRYAMPKHGFARHATFDIAEQTGDAATLVLSDTAETRAIYPFDFRFDIAFALSGAMLTVTATIANTGTDPMPASLGFHPAFAWPLPFGEPRAGHRIRFAHDEPAPVRRIDREGLLTAEEHPTPVVGDTLLLRDALFEDDALIFDRLTSRRVVYSAGKGPGIAVGFEGFPTLGVWTKPGAGFICVEPWQGCSDPVGFTGDVREKPGIVVIAPREQRRFAMTIALVDEAG